VGRKARSLRDSRVAEAGNRITVELYQKGNPVFILTEGVKIMDSRATAVQTKIKIGWQRSEGFTLVEVLIAMVILSVSLLPSQA